MADKRVRFAMLGEASYRNGALDRLADARLLLQHGQIAGSVYMAGRGAESMLRALVWRGDPDVKSGKKSLESGHSLRQLLTLVRNLGLLRTGGGDRLENDVQWVSRLWFNNMRFVDSSYIERYWSRIKVLGKGRTFKAVAEDSRSRCEAIIKRGEILCQRSR